MSQYQTAGINARLKLFALLEAQSVPVIEADDLVAALEAGAQCEVGELEAWRRPLGARCSWTGGVTAVSEALVGIADRDRSRRGGRSAGAAELAVPIADVRRRERADLVRLEAFGRPLLPRTHLYTTQRRGVLEVLGEAGGLCRAWTAEMSSGDVILCTREAGHCDPDDKLPFKDGKPGGWHKADASIWNDLGAACIPHAAI